MNRHSNLLPAALLLLLAGCTCGALPPSRPCSTDSECSAGETCRSGSCSGLKRDAGEVDLDASDPFADLDGGGCGASLCGKKCCEPGEKCETSECHKDCGADTRCGEPGKETCCTAAQVCYVGACVTPGAACTASSQCAKTAYCDPSLGKCLPLTGANACEYRPPAGQFSPGVLWTSPAPTDLYTQVMMAPVVIDVNGDGTPDVLANYFTVSGGYGGAGVMRALSGDDGHVLWTSADTAADHVNPPASIAAADLDGSGKIVAITVAQNGTLVAFDAKTGVRLWNSTDGTGAAASCAASWGGPAIADLDGDGSAEIVCGLGAFSRTGKLLWSKGLGGGAVGPLTVVADLDGDSKPDISDGAQAFRGDGTALGWTGTGSAGFPAVGDFVNAAGAPGRDGKPELAVVRAGTLTLVNGQTGAILAPASALPSLGGGKCIQGGSNPGSGGPPTVADFDGDGQPEVGVADLDCYTVFKLDNTGGALAWKVLWSKQVQDHSSSVTGSSVFDFDGDGKAEVVYADEVALHVFNGPDGTEIFTKPHCSGTTYETPIIVDVNGNGRADIVICENTYAAGGLQCDPAVKPGIQVIHDGRDNWVNTRPIWNQHTYHVTNVCDGQDKVCGSTNTYGRIPKIEPSSWLFNNAPAGSAAPPLNNYRQNVQGDGVFNAPDLVALALTFDRTGCPAKMKLSARVTNKGALGLLPGVKVAFYQDVGGKQLIGVASTTGRLLPGQSEVVTFEAVGLRGPVKVFAVVDDDGTGKGSASECNESNNTSPSVDVSCVGPT